MRQLLRLSGLADPIYWLGYYFSLQTLLVLLEAFMLVILYWENPFLARTNPLLVYILLIFYGNGAAVHGIFLSCFLSSSEYTSGLESCDAAAVKSHSLKLPVK